MGVEAMVAGECVGGGGGGVLWEWVGVVSYWR